MALDDRNVLAALDARIRTMLPEEYQDTYESCSPSPMRSAGLKFDAGRPRRLGRDVGELLRPGDGRRPAAQGRAARAGARAAIDADPSATTRSAGDLPRHPAGHRPSSAAVADARAGCACRATAMRWPAGCCGRSSWRTSPRADGRDARPSGRPAVPPREGNQERHHGHRQDLPLLGGPHAARASSRRSASCSCDHGRRVAARRAGAAGRATPRDATGRLAGAIERGPASGVGARGGMARRRVRERPRGGLDDARAGREQRARAPRSHRALRAGQCGDRSRGGRVAAAVARVHRLTVAS